MTLFDKLAEERRARLVAERLLAQRSRDLDLARAEVLKLGRALTEQRAIARDAAAAGSAQEARRDAERPELGQAQRQAIMAERRLWDSINTVRDGFAVYNANHELVIANQAYLGLFSAFPEVRPGVAYRRVLEILALEGLVVLGEAAPQDWIAMMQARREGDIIEPIVLSLARGSTVRVIDRRARGGDLVSLVRDITEPARHEAELHEARLRAEAASRSKSAFLANMSHEIRTPMNGVVGMAELLCDTPLSEEQRLYAETIRSSGEALLNIINDVLDFSKIEADKLTLHPEPFDLERCIHEVLILLQAGARKRQIDLMMDYDLFLPTRFVVDPGRMRQVLTNLIGNAVKFTEQGHVLIRVVGVEAGEGRQQINVTVEDTGIGIAPDDVERIFAEFAQVEDQANRKFEGTGLGLAISRRLIELMGGQIWVDSDLGCGSCFGFSLTLPVAEEAPHLPRVPITLNHVLVADDQLINRTILERQLGSQGIAVTLCESGAEVQFLLAGDGAGAFDLLITDHEMPGMDGLELTSRLRAGGSTIPVVLLSSSPTVLGEHPETGALAAILQKPLLRRDLMRLLQQLSQPEPAHEEPPEPDTPAEPADLARRMRVLAAEDNKTNRLVFSKMAGDLDIDLVFAEDGRQAVDAFVEHQPDLIFMDISMPQMDGREATRAIRQLAGGAQVAIVALTAHALDGDRDDILAAGLDHYMTKPLRKSLLLDIIRRYQPDDARPPIPQLTATG